MTAMNMELDTVFYISMKKRIVDAKYVRKCKLKFTEWCGSLMEAYYCD